MLDKTFLPRAIEAKFYAAWEKCGSFRSYQKPDAEPYVIMMPPPNVLSAYGNGKQNREELSFLNSVNWGFRQIGSVNDLPLMKG